MLLPRSCASDTPTPGRALADAAAHAEPGRAGDLGILVRLAELLRTAPAAESLAEQAIALLRGHLRAEYGAVVRFGAAGHVIVASDGLAGLPGDLTPDRLAGDLPPERLLDAWHRGRAVLCAPSFASGPPIGAVYLLAGTTGRIDADAQRLVEAVATFLGVTLDRHRLIDENRELLAARGHRETMAGMLAQDLAEAVANVGANIDRAVSSVLHEEALCRARRGTSRLAGMIEDLIDLGRLEADDLLLELRPVKLASLISDAVIRWSDGADRKAVRLVVPGLSRGACTLDQRLIDRVLDNLISSALRNAPEGSAVTLSAEEVGAEVWIAVRDHAADLSSRGLGLRFCALVARAHGGRVFVDSRSGGDRYVLALPR
jgi:signal transduction histidine kinase